MFNNKKNGQAFIIATVFIVVAGLVMGYLLLNSLYAGKNTNEKLGSYEAGIVDALINSNTMMIIIDKDVKYSSDVALKRFGENGGLADNALGADADTSMAAGCGNYIYRLWNSEDRNCFPLYNETFSSIFDNALDSSIAGNKNVQNLGFGILTNKVKREYTYDNYMQQSYVNAVADNSYSFFVLSDPKVLTDQTVVNYLTSKGTLGQPSADIPGVPYVGANPTNYQAATNRNIQYIVIHYTAGNSISSAMSRFLASGQASSHYIIGSTSDNFAVVEPVMEKDIAYHAGCSADKISYVCKYKDPANTKAYCMDAKFSDINTKSIGIEVVNLGTDCSRSNSCDVVLNNVGWQSYPGMQMKKLEYLVAYLSNKYHIPASNIIGHSDVTACKIDPGEAFDWATFRKSVADAQKLSNDDLLQGIANTALLGDAPVQLSKSVKTTAQLSVNDQKKIDDTKKRLMALKLPDGTTALDYATQISVQEDVPLGVALGVITQESTGDYTLKSSANAIGLMGMTEKTYAGLKYDNKCTWDTLGKDVGCQIRSGIRLLRRNYDEVGSETLFYNCPYYCDPNHNCQQPINAVYTSWEAAVRRYNGGGSVTNSPITSGCTNYPDFTYVNKVMRWASAWGYTSNSVTQIASTQELSSGILGTYTAYPSFSTNINFDFDLFSELTLYMKDTVKDCAASANDVKKQECVDAHVKKFNDEISSQYVVKGNAVSLSSSCDDNPTYKAAADFVQSVEDCSESNEADCSCMITNAPAKLMVTLKAGDGYTTFSYSDKDPKNNFDIITYNNFYDASKNIVSGNTIDLNTTTVTKSSDDLMFAPAYTKTCAPLKDRFRLCLKTGYQYYDYSLDRLAYLELKFAIMIHDSLAPKPIPDLALSNMQHTVNNLILTWTPGTEKDIESYIIYLANSQSVFNGDISAIHKLNYRTLALRNGHSDYNSIDTANPVCILSHDQQNLPYCLFKYNAVDVDGKNIQINLAANALYYMKSSNKFLYILDSTDPYNQLTAGKDKFIAVTAVDSDGNEISNAAGQKLVVKNIKPLNNIEPGLVNNVNYNPGASKITVNWDALPIYIDDSQIKKTGVIYNVYMQNGICSSDLTKITQPVNPISSSQTKADVLLSLLIKGPYCIIVTSKLDGKEYLYGIGTNYIYS